MTKNLSTYTGLIAGIALVCVLLIIRFVFHQPLQGWPQALVLLVYAATTAVSLYLFKQTTNTTSGKLLFGQGFKTFVAMAFVLVLFTFIYYKYDTSVLEAGIAANNELLLKEGNHTPSEINENANKLRQVFMPMMLSVTTIILLLLGTVVSTITIAIIKKKN